MTIQPEISQWIYHVCTVNQWNNRASEGYQQEGPFTHLSTAIQLEKSVQLHLGTVNNLLLICVSTKGLNGLRWEVSREGQSFPHLYGVLKDEFIQWTCPLPDPKISMRRTPALALLLQGKNS